MVRGHGRAGSPPPARAARSARSAWRSPASRPSRRGCACRHGAWSAFRRGRARPLCARGAALRPLARRLARCAAWRHRARHVDAARGVSAGADRLHGDGRLAHVARAGADPAHRRDRDAGRGHSAVHRQDRHVDAEPHDGRRAARRRRVWRRRWRRLPDGRSATLLESASSPARPSRSIRWRRPFSARRRTRCRGTPPHNGRDLQVGIRAAPRSARDDACLGDPGRTSWSSPPRARPRRSPISATCRQADARASPRRRRDGARGMRVLGVARASLPPDIARPATPHDFAFEFLGLVGLADPLRPGVPAAVRECRAAGIRVVMITGDYPETARRSPPGRARAGEVVTGGELDGIERRRACAAGRAPPTSSPASCRSRSCASSRR